MNYSPPPISPSSSTQNTTTPSTPTLPHSIVAAAHCLAPLDDLHLAHLINELKPSPPVWSFYDHQPNPDVPVITPNDRLRSDELADLPAPEAERLHAAYDIEDYLDATPDRLLVYGPSTPIREILLQVKQLLTTKKINLPTSNHIVYVARVSFQPIDGPDSSYKWAKGGPDLIRFELDQNHTLLPHLHQPITINWSPVELALSQALEVGHQLLALLHSRQFAEILSTFGVLEEFRPINPIVWLVDPVEYAHAQLRETTEWGWSEHHVELNSLHRHQSVIRSNSFDHPSSTGLTPRDYAHSRPHSKSHLSHELYMIDEDQQVSDRNGSNHPSPPSSCPNNPHAKPAKNLADDLPKWLNDLLDRRLPRLLSLPDGCFSYELLNSCPPSNPSSQHIPCNVAPKSIPSIISSPPEKINTISPDGPSNSTKLATNSKWTILSALATPTRAIILDQRSVANSVPSFDQHHLLSPSVTNSLRHVQTNTLKYYPCKACSEHAFKLALSHKLNEEKRRLLLDHNNTSGVKPSSLTVHQARPNHRRGSKNTNLTGMGDHERTSSAEFFIEDVTSSPSKLVSNTTTSNNINGTMQTTSTTKPTCTSCHKSSDLSHTSMVNNNNNQHHHVKAPPGPGILLDDPPVSSDALSFPNVLGLGSKGKAIKEAMDREHDEFINHQKSLSSILRFKSHLNNDDDDDLNPDSKITSWDEGEVIEDYT